MLMHNHFYIDSPFILLACLIKKNVLDKLLIIIMCESCLV